MRRFPEGNSCWVIRMLVKVTRPCLGLTTLQDSLRSLAFRLSQPKKQNPPLYHMYMISPHLSFRPLPPPSLTLTTLILTSSNPSSHF